MSGVIKFKNKMEKAFKILRVLGYWCKQKHTCCSSCGWAEVPDGLENKVVFLDQDYERLKEGSDELCLAWAGDHNEIITVLKLAGIEASCEDPEHFKIVCQTKTGPCAPGL